MTEMVTNTIETNICVWEMLGKILERMWSMKVMKIKPMEKISTWIGVNVNWVGASNRMLLSFLAFLFSCGFIIRISGRDEVDMGMKPNKRIYRKVGKKKHAPES